MDALADITLPDRHGTPFSLRSLREANHSSTHGGRETPANRGCACAYSSSRANACLHGNLRLGHEHLKAGPPRSTCVW